MTARGVVRIAALGGVLAYRWDRRQNERAIAEDPEWAELQRAIPSTSFDVTSADGTRLHAEIFGPDGAPTIVLVHGWCCSVRFWHYQLRDLADVYRVVAYDLRGHGGSDRPANGDYSTDALAADLDAILRACVPAGEQTVAVGHSMGGMSIVAWAGAHPDDVGRRLAGVVLVDTGMGQLIAKARIGPCLPALSMIRTAVGRLVLGLPLPLPAPPDPVLLRGIRYIALSPTARPGYVAFCAQMVVDCPPRVRAAFGITLARLDLAECLPSLAVPTVVLVGRQDVLTPPEQAQLIAMRVPGAVLCELAGGGHMAPVEAHEEVTDHIRAVVERALVAPTPREGATS